MIQFVSPPTLEHVSEVSASLREADRRELETLRPFNAPGEVLAECLDTKGESFVVLKDDKPACLLGHEPSEDVLKMGGNGGSIWLMGTDLIELNKIKFLRLSKKVCEEILSKYDYIWNIVDSRNELHIRWLQWLGFLFVDVLPIGADEVPFYLVVKPNVRS